jgi:hypothetical protein
MTEILQGKYNIEYSKGVNNFGRLSSKEVMKTKRIKKENKKRK